MLSVLILCVVSKDYGFDTKGIALEKLKLYNRANSFSCFNDSSKAYPLSVINDDYCDCADGSDEPGTSACPNSMFYCENKGYKPAYILSSRVDDNVCDDECCDGTDENDSLIKCPNICAEKNEKINKERAYQLQVLKTGLLVKSNFIQESSKKKTEMSAELVTLEPKIESLKTDLNKMKELKDGKQNILDQESNKKLSEETNNENIRLHEQNKALRELVAKLGSIMGTLEADHNPNYHDMAVKRSIEEYKQIKEQNQVYFTNTTGSEVDQKDIQVEAMHESREVPEVDTSEHQNHENSAEKEIEELNAKINQLEEELDKINEKINTAKVLEKFPVNDHSVSSVLFDQCYETTQGKYTYSMCLNQDVMQKSDTESILLGHFESQLNNTLMFKNGQNCWNGPDRSVMVRMVCHTENILSSVSEPNKCEYRMTFLTPMACEETDLKQYNDLSDTEKPPKPLLTEKPVGEEYNDEL